MNMNKLFLIHATTINFAQYQLMRLVTNGLVMAMTRQLLLLLVRHQIQK